jgi:predicted dehydrogenase
MIGAGYMGQIAHLANFAQITECRVAALADLRPQLRAQVAHRYGIADVYESHRELLDDGRVDAVVVVTPRSQTFSIALECLQAGQHVLTEKPIAVTSAEGQTLVETARQNELRYCVGYMKRYDEGVDAAKQILDELRDGGELGPIQFVRAHCYMGDGFCNADGHIVTDEAAEYPENYGRVAPEWVPDDQKENYGAFLNTYTHVTNLLRYLTGEQPQVDYTRLRCTNGQLCVLDYGSFVASLETGTSSSRHWEEQIAIFFADGRLTLDMPPPLLRNTPARVRLYRAGNRQEIVSPQCGWSWSFKNQAQAFVSDVLANSESRIEGSEALLDLELAESLWRHDLAK